MSNQTDHLHPYLITGTSTLQKAHTICFLTDLIYAPQMRFTENQLGLMVTGRQVIGSLLRF